MLLQILLQVQPPKDFITPESITTFTGASGAVWILSNLARMAFKKDSTIPCFIVSLIVSYVGMSILGTLHGGIAIFMGFLNGALLFFTALGVQGFAVAAKEGQVNGKVNLESKKSVGFLTPWFKPSDKNAS